MKVERGQGRVVRGGRRERRRRVGLGERWGGGGR